MAGGERIRLFCAYPLPSANVAEIVAWQQEHLSGLASRGARLIPAGNLHVTVAFLGSRPADQVRAIGAALAAAARAAGPAELRPVSFRQTGARTTGARTTGGVGMIVCDDVTGAADAFVAELRTRLETIGAYRREARPWLPHVTVFRSGREEGAPPPVANIRSINVVRAALYASALRPAGAQYDVLETVALGGR